MKLTMAILDNDGDVTRVQGSGSKPYTLKNVGGVLSCDCPAWRNVGGPIDKRTCKHLKKVRGDAAETARIGAFLKQAGAVQVTLTPAGLTGGKAITADADYAQTVLDRAASEGRKLRQDEKAKLHGPPVLLAHSFEDSDVDPTGWWMSEKLDGVRAYWDGTQFLSRQGNVFHAPAWFKAGLPDHPLDGELWIARQKFQNTISVVKRLDGGEAWRPVQYLVWDLPHLAVPFEARQDALEEVCTASSCKHLKVVYQTRCKGKAHLKQELDQLVAVGAEGLMIRQPGSLYVATRSSTLLKVKPFKDAEGVVVGHEPGKGRHKGRLGGIVVRTANGKEFNVGTGFTDDERRNPPKIGSVVTYRFTELTDGGTGVPKCASFVSVRDYE